MANNNTSKLQEKILVAAESLRLVADLNAQPQADRKDLGNNLRRMAERLDMIASELAA